MGYTFNASAQNYLINTAETLTTATVYVTKVSFEPATQGHSVTITDTADEVEVFLKANAGNIDQVWTDFSAENGGRGRKMVGLKVSAIGASGTGYIYLRKER